MKTALRNVSQLVRIQMARNVQVRAIWERLARKVLLHVVLVNVVIDLFKLVFFPPASNMSVL